MSITHATAIKTDIANLVTGKAATSYAPGATQKLILYSGTPPANAAASLSSNTAIATLTSLVWGTNSSGVITVTATADSSAVGGAATFFRITQSDGTTAIIQGLVATSASDCNINSTTIAAGANVSLTSGSYTSPP